MKVNELMIGDWVKHSITGQKGKVYRICGNEYIAFIDGDTQSELVEPIPLTPEILEKNGFKMEFYSDYKVYELNNFKVCKSYCDYFEVCDLWKDSDFGWEIISFCPCIYVHQLQHALKLCGIDKEIVV